MPSAPSRMELNREREEKSVAFGKTTGNRKAAKTTPHTHPSPKADLATRSADCVIEYRVLRSFLAGAFLWLSPVVPRLKHLASCLLLGRNEYQEPLGL